MSSKMLLRLAASASLVALGACATTTVEPSAPLAPAVAEAPAPAEPALTQASAHDRLFEVFKASDEANL